MSAKLLCSAFVFSICVVLVVSSSSSRSPGDDDVRKVPANVALPSSRFDCPPAEGISRKKYLAYLVAMLNRNVAMATRCLTRAEHTKHVDWNQVKLRNTRLDDMVTELERDFRPPQEAESNPKTAVTEELLNWFLTGVGEENRLHHVSTTFESGITVKILDFKRSNHKTDLITLRVEKRLESSTAKPVTGLDVEDDFFAPRVHPIPIHGAELDPGKLVLDIVALNGRLEGLLNHLNCDPQAKPVILRKVLSQTGFNSPSSEIYELCHGAESPAKTHKRRHVPREDFEEAKNSAYAKPEDPMDELYGFAGNVWSSLTGLTQTLRRKKVKTTKEAMEEETSTLPYQEMTTIATVAIGNVTQPAFLPQPSPSPQQALLSQPTPTLSAVVLIQTTTSPSIQSDAPAPKKHVYGSFFEDESSEDEEAFQEPDHGPSIGSVIRQFTANVFSPKTHEAPEEEVSTTTESVLTAGADADFGEDDDEMQVDDAGAGFQLQDDEVEKLKEMAAAEQKRVEANRILDKELEDDLESPVTSSTVNSSSLDVPAVRPSTTPMPASDFTTTVTSVKAEARSSSPRPPKIFPGGHATTTPRPPTTPRVTTARTTESPLETNKVPEETWQTAEASEVNEDEFHRQVVISIGLMSLMGIVTIGIVAMLRNAVVSRSPDRDDDLDIEAIMATIPPTERRVTVTTTVGDDATPVKPKEAFQMTSKNGSNP